MEVIKEIDLRPFTRTLWDVNVDQSFKNVWADLQRETYMVELRSVSEGIRKVATTHIGSERVKEDLEMISDLGLRFEPLRKAKRVSGFAHRFYNDVAPGEAYDVYGVVATERANLVAFKRASEAGDHIAMGGLLGYPRCCSEFFVKVWPTDYDPIWSAALNTSGVEIVKNEARISDFYTECNILLRYFGVRVVPHLVCSYTCMESAELGQKFLEFVDGRQELLKILSSPMTWDCWRAAATITTPWFRGITNSMNFAEKRVVRLGGLGAGES